MTAESAEKRVFETYGTYMVERLKRHYLDLEKLQDVFDLTQENHAIKLDVALRSVSFLLEYCTDLAANRREGVEPDIAIGFAVLLNQFADEFRKITPLEDMLRPVGEEEAREIANKQSEEEKS